MVHHAVVLLQNVAFASVLGGLSDVIAQNLEIAFRNSGSRSNSAQRGHPVEGGGNRFEEDSGKEAAELPPARGTPPESPHADGDMGKRQEDEEQPQEEQKFDVWRTLRFMVVPAAFDGVTAFEWNYTFLPWLFPGHSVGVVAGKVLLDNTIYPVIALGGSMAVNSWMAGHSKEYTIEKLKKDYWKLHLLYACANVPADLFVYSVLPIHLQAATFKVGDFAAFIFLSYFFNRKLSGLPGLH
eukprot:TRINITY_DN94240_c0_g1_i1.p1 TRINITY_DN94240_c0_g1~~TRINITY_DN94240_c0_g1_i1.p1  ORF type:complete len:240 (+),score=54.32 TRINITY_DN94240_c0_g1_i1:75-794(+)